MERHILEIAENGDVTITVQGVKGRRCKDATREIEQALGTTVSSTPTKEMYEQPNDVQHRGRN
jgi:hypothetical protein